MCDGKSNKTKAYMVTANGKHIIGEKKTTPDICRGGYK